MFLAWLRVVEDFQALDCFWKPLYLRWPFKAGGDGKVLLRGGAPSDDSHFPRLDQTKGGTSILSSSSQGWCFDGMMRARVTFMSRFFFPSQHSVRHIWIKRDWWAENEESEGENNGEKVICKDIVFLVLPGCRRVLLLEGPWGYKAASKHLSCAGEWHSASQCCALHHSCSTWSAGSDFNWYLLHFLG